MKLEYVYRKNNNVKKTLLYSLILFLFSEYLWLFYWILDNDFNMINDRLYWIVGLIIGLMIFFVYGLIPTIIIYLFNIRRNKKNNEILNNGVKKVGYIYASYLAYEHKLALYTSRYILLVDIDHKTYKIDWVCKNKAYKILDRYLKFCDTERTKLLNRFDWLEYRDSFEKVYIDVYIYNDKVYADLNSVNIDKIAKMNN